jgi:hypothetical protein
MAFLKLCSVFFFPSYATAAVEIPPQNRNASTNRIFFWRSVTTQFLNYFLELSAAVSLFFKYREEALKKCKLAIKVPSNSAVNLCTQFISV